MNDKTHLDSNARGNIEQCLNTGMSFKQIAGVIGKDCTTVSREIRRHRVSVFKGAPGRVFNDCESRADCLARGICLECDKKNLCRNCGKCLDHCPYYRKEICPRLIRSPYVCNGCPDKPGCTLEKKLYLATDAHSEYRNDLSESRKGFNLDEDEISRIDAIIAPLIRNGQSIHRICQNHGDEIMLSERTIYNLISAGILTVRNIDLPRKVRFRPRSSAKHDNLTVDVRCREGRTYSDFKDYISDNPDTALVQADTVEGTKGGKVLLTIHFCISRFMLAFLRDRNTARSVTDVFDSLKELLGIKLFSRMFPVVLLDRGSEFSDPTAIEFHEGKQVTRVFYCDPNSAWQKGACEVNHEFIRRIRPKGQSLNDLTPAKVNLMMNHVNSYGRESLNERPPYVIASAMYGEDVLKKLGAELIPPDEIVLRPSLLK